MAIATSSDSSAWSANIGTATDTPFQCQRGSVYVTWDGTAAIGDGLKLEMGQMIVIPGGVTFRWAPADDATATVFYESFGI